MMAHKAVEQPQPEQKPVEDKGLTASIYFGHKKKSNAMRNATMAGLGSLMLLTATPMITSCDKDNAYAEAKATAEAIANASVNGSDSTGGSGCGCCGKRDTIYKYDTIVVDTGSYHVTHDTIVKWIDDYHKPIPLDTLAKWDDEFDIETPDPSRKNIVYYQGTRDWEYGENFKANVNLVESSKNVLVYDREDFDWEGNHTGWGKDVYRIPTTRFVIQTYNGKKLTSPKGIFYETYSNPWNEKSSIHDNNLVQRYFFQTRGDSVDVYSYDPQTGLYREDGRFSKGYLEQNSILLTDQISNLLCWCKPHQTNRRELQCRYPQE